MVYTHTHTTCEKTMTDLCDVKHQGITKHLPFFFLNSRSGGESSTTIFDICYDLWFMILEFLGFNNDLIHFVVLSRSGKFFDQCVMNYLSVHHPKCNSTWFSPSAHCNIILRLADIRNLCENGSAELILWALKEGIHFFLSEKSCANLIKNGDLDVFQRVCRSHFSSPTFKYGFGILHTLFYPLTIKHNQFDMFKWLIEETCGGSFWILDLFDGILKYKRPHFLKLILDVTKIRVFEYFDHYILRFAREECFTQIICDEIIKHKRRDEEFIQNVLILAVCGKNQRLVKMLFADSLYCLPKSAARFVFELFDHTTSTRGESSDLYSWVVSQGWWNYRDPSPPYEYDEEEILKDDVWNPERRTNYHCRKKTHNSLYSRDKRLNRLPLP